MVLSEGAEESLVSHIRLWPMSSRGDLLLSIVKAGPTWGSSDPREGQKSPSEVLAVCFRGADVEGEGWKQERLLLPWCSQSIKDAIQGEYVPSTPTCTWHITRLSFICFSSGKIKAFLAPQSVPHGDYSSRLWPSHCARLCGQCLALECGLVPSLSLLEIPREESNAHRNLVISSSPSPRRDATLLRSEGVGLALAYGYRRTVNRVLRSPS